MERARDGRRNRYTVRRDLPITVSRPSIDLNALLAMLLPATSSEPRREMEPAAV